MRRICVLEDKLHRMGFPVKLHCVDPRQLYLGETASAEDRAGMPALGLRVGTFNPGTLKGAHAKTPLRAVEIITEARGLGLNLIAVQETRLVGDEKLDDLPGRWQFVGSNRVKLLNSNRNPGGGVGWLINVPKGFEVARVERPNGHVASKLERCWLRVVSAHSTLFLGCVYWPPGGKADQHRKDISLLRDDLTSLSTLGIISILGDLNARLPTRLTPLPCPRARLLLPLLNDFDLVVRNTREATHVRGASSSIIDYLLFPKTLNVRGVRVEALVTGEGHRLVSAAVPDLVPLRKTNVKRERINTPTAPLAKEFQEKLETALIERPHASLDELTREIVDTARATFGLKKRGRYGDDQEMPVWWSQELALILERKRVLLRLPFRNVEEEIELADLSKDLRALSRLRSREYFNNLCSRLGQELRKGGPTGRAAWRSLDKLLKPPAKPATAEPGSAAVTNLWNSLWSSKDEKEESEEHEKWSSDHAYFKSWKGDAASEAFLADVTAKEVREAAASFKDYKAADMSGLINEVLKVLPEAMYARLAAEFTKMLRGDVYPAAWSEAFVVLLFKSGDPANEANYRPITLLSAMFRLFESVLLVRLRAFLEVHPFIDPQQMGFQSKRSCEELATALRLAIEKAWSLGKSLFVGCLDFRKAFDSVPHSRLFQKLRNSPLPPPIVRLICALVSMHVSILPNGARILILCGVPQGSLLAPFLFLVFINDLPAFVIKRLKGRRAVSPFDRPVILFADDTTPLAYTAPLFQLVLNAANAWSIENRLDFQHSKTKVACFNKAAPKSKLKFGEQEIEFTTDISVVGVPFSTTAMLNGTQTLGPPLKSRKTITRCKELAKNGFDTPTGLTVLNMFVSSIALYGAPVHAIHAKAQIAQNDLMQAILGTYRNCSLARSHLCLSLLRVASAAAVRRVSSVMRFRCSPISQLREWIDESLLKGWAWGKMLSSDLVNFGLRELWTEYASRVDSAEHKLRDSLLREFKRKVRCLVQEVDETSNRTALFDATIAREILPWRGVHPACTVGPRGYGYKWLRDSFKPPHLLHGRGTSPATDLEDDCPHCLKPGAFKPSHLLACPSLGPPLSPPSAYSLAPSRWNLLDTTVLKLFLDDLKRRHLKNPPNLT
jgi:hypothetical protein